MDNTKTLGLVGHPIEHSLSPAMHNAVFRGLGLDCRYVVFDVRRGELERFIKSSKEKDIIGLNVTIPHKVEVIGYVDKLSREAELIGAINTMKFNKKVVGYNTDGIGCVRALNEAGVSLKDKKVLILGAGGAARAIGFQCVLEGATVSISNREVERDMAVSLAADIEKKLNKKCDVVDFNVEKIKESLKKTDILINATPVGMYPKTDESVVPAEIIPKTVRVMDIVYNPMETKLLREAKKRGCKTIDGVGMLVHQGAESLKIWLGIDAPIETMRDAVTERLKS